MNKITAQLKTSLTKIAAALKRGTSKAVKSEAVASAGSAAKSTVAGAARSVANARNTLLVFAVLGAAAYAVYKNPPVQTIEPGEVAIRANLLTGGVTEFAQGSVFVVPALHELRRYSLRDQTYRAEQMSKADGESPLQSVEGLSVGIDLSVRYALDASRIAGLSKNLSPDFQNDIVEPALQGVVYKTFAKYTVREIFSTKRLEIQQIIEAELKTKLASDGLVLRGVYIGKIDLPADYRRSMDTLLAEELATQKMRYTLELKDKRIKETELDGEAEKVKREKSAEAAGREQIIAAKAQEEAMKHVLPFKQRQIEQRQLEAEAEKVSTIRRSEGNAQARRIEASGEADSRQKLADAEVYRLDKVGKSNSEQMAREGVLITKHPLLINKAMADKLSDKIQVIIAPPSTNGDFIGATLIGSLKNPRGQNVDAMPAQNPAMEADLQTSEVKE